MKTKLGKKLVLNRETVRELTDSQLDQAAGGATLLVTCKSCNLCGTNSFPNTCICYTQADPTNCPNC